MSHERTLDSVRRQISTHSCPRCQGPAYCAMQAGKSATLCWCMSEPKTYNPETDAEQCLCRYCLRGDDE